MTKGDRWQGRHGGRSLGWAIQPSAGEPDTGEPDAIKVARPVREGAVGNLRKPVAPVVRRRESQQGAGRLLHRKLKGMNAEHELQNCWKTSPFQTLMLDCRPLSLRHSCVGPFLKESVK